MAIPPRYDDIVFAVCDAAVAAARAALSAPDAPELRARRVTVIIDTDTCTAETSRYVPWPDTEIVEATTGTYHAQNVLITPRAPTIPT